MAKRTASDQNSTLCIPAAKRQSREPSPVPEGWSSELVLPIGQEVAVQTLGGAKSVSTKKALVIGINYSGDNELTGCVNDALRVESMLVNRYSFPSSNIWRMIDTQSGSIFPNRHHVLEGLKWLTSGARSGDHLFFFFAGHGTQVHDRDGDELDNKDEIVVDGRGDMQLISDDELFYYLIEPLPAGVKLTAVMDCCHSGSGLDLPYRWSTSRGHWMWSAKPGHRECVADVRLISGCPDHKVSYELPTGRGGALTSALCDILDQNSGACIESHLLKKLRSKLSDQVPQLTATQLVDPRSRWWNPIGPIFQGALKTAPRPTRRKQPPHNPEEQLQVGQQLLCGSGLAQHECQHRQNEDDGLVSSWPALWSLVRSVRALFGR